MKRTALFALVFAAGLSLGWSARPERHPPAAAHTPGGAVFVSFPTGNGQRMHRKLIPVPDMHDDDGWLIEVDGKPTYYLVADSPTAAP
jgi:hypothetical protein